MNGPPPLRVEHYECRDCRRPLRLLVGDPLPRGWRTAPRDGCDKAKAPRVRRKCDYICPICWGLSRSRLVTYGTMEPKGGAP